MGMYDELQGSGKKGKKPDHPITLGTVVENWDKDHPGMVKVKIHMEESSENVTGWIPVASPYSGSKYGFYFLPEIDDEVVIAYDHGVGECPVVVGSIWNKENLPPEGAPQEKNTIKMIRTKGGHEIVFEETKDAENICVKSSTGLYLKLEDKPSVVTLSDKDGKNYLKMDCKNGEVTLLADQKISLQANGKEMLLLDGKADKIVASAKQIQLKASASFQAEGKSTEIKGDSTKVSANSSMEVQGVNTTVKGSAKLGVESSGMTEVKGSMVKIN